MTQKLLITFTSVPRWQIHFFLHCISVQFVSHLPSPSFSLSREWKSSINELPRMGWVYVVCQRVCNDIRKPRAQPGAKTSLLIWVARSGVIFLRVRSRSYRANPAEGRYTYHTYLYTYIFVYTLYTKGWSSLKIWAIVVGTRSHFEKEKPATWQYFSEMSTSTFESLIDFPLNYFNMSFALRLYSNLFTIA